MGTATAAAIHTTAVDPRPRLTNQLSPHFVKQSRKVSMRASKEPAIAPPAATLVNSLREMSLLLVIVTPELVAEENVGHRGL